MHQERRQFNRVSFNGLAKLECNGESINCEIKDLSLHGVLISLPSPFLLVDNQTCQLTIPLTDDISPIHMSLKVAYVKNKEVGLECTEIDLESISHLRRIIELNLGDASLLERDFSALAT
ncbi:PilZ domain-containing protein [Aliikangiella sp. IMCC44653]